MYGFRWAGVVNGCLMFVLFLPAIFPEKVTTEEAEGCENLLEDDTFDEAETIGIGKPPSIFALLSCIYGFFAFYLSGVFFFT